MCSSPSRSPGEHPARLRHTRRRIRHAAARRQRRRLPRRPLRPQAGPGRRNDRHGYRDLRHRPDADVRADRRPGPDMSSRSASSRGSRSAPNGAARSDGLRARAMAPARHVRRHPAVGQPAGHRPRQRHSRRSSPSKATGRGESRSCSAPCSSSSRWSCAETLRIARIRGGKAKGKTERNPFVTTIREDWRDILRVIALRVVESCAYYSTATYLLSLHHRAQRGRSQHRARGCRRRQRDRGRHDAGRRGTD